MDILMVIFPDDRAADNHRRPDGAVDARPHRVDPGRIQHRRERHQVVDLYNYNLCAGAVGDVGKKLDAVRAAVRHSYPTADISDMLAEIERGYGVSDRR
jgi:hypothetical protein